MYKMSLVHLRIKPGQTCQHMHTRNHTKPLMLEGLNIEPKHSRKVLPMQFDLVQHWSIIGTKSSIVLGMTVYLGFQPMTFVAFPLLNRVGHENFNGR